MKNYLIYGIVITALTSLVSCEKIVAEDISEQTPVLILPNINDTLPQNQVHFKWEELEGATRYRLEVASPSFTAPVAYPLDSLISSTEFVFTLDSAEYEVRLTATNGGYDSQSTAPRKFWVGVGGSTGGNIQLNSPANGSYVNAQFNKNFSWNNLSGASSYEFSLRTGSNFPSGVVVHSQTNVSTSNLTVATNITEGEYHWGVKAFVNQTELPYVTSVFYVDTTDPNDPLLDFPGNFALENAGVIDFTWSNGNDLGNIQAPVHSVIEVATNASFANVIFTQDLTTETVSTNLPIGTYFWRVYNYDEAQNTSGYSVANSFTLQ